MWEGFAQLLDTSGFMPHGHCFLWTPALLWSYVISDAIIALSYYSIPVALWYFAEKRRDLPYRWVFVLFGVFVMACGTTHLLAIWNIWVPNYWLDAGLKVFTAAASLGTAIVLWPLIPEALAIPSRQQLTGINRELKSEARRRQQAETDLMAANRLLIKRVAERTAELETANRVLQASEARFRATSENASDAIVTADASGEIVGWNAAAERLFGYTEAEARGLPLTQLMPPRYREGHLAGMQRVRDGGARRLVGTTLEAHGVTKGGGEVPLELSVSQWETEEGQFFTGIIRDISDRKLAARAIERQKDLYDMLSQTNQTIVRVGNRDELFNAICRIAVEHGHYLFAAIRVIDADRHWVPVVAHYGEDAGYLEQAVVSLRTSDAEGRGPAGAALRDGVRAVNNDFLNDDVTAPWHEIARQVGVGAVGVFPLRLQGEVIGALVLYAREPGFFTDDLLPTLDEMATDVSFALDNMAREAERTAALDALRAAVQVVENSPVMLFRWRPLPGWPVEYMSQNVRRWGYAAPSESGTELLFSQLVHADDRERVAAEVARYTREGRSEFLQEYRIVTTLGAVLWIDDQTTVVRDQDRRVVRYEGVLTDITERKFAEQALRSSEQKYRGIYENLQDVYVESDLDGTIREISPQIEVISRGQYRREDLLGKSTGMFYPDAHRREEFITALRNDGTVKDFEGAFLNRDGSTVMCSISAKIQLGADKAPWRICATVRDVTERKLAQESLQAAEAKFRGLIEQSLAGVYISRDGVFQYANPRLEQLLGYGPGQMVGIRSDDIIIADDLPILLAERDKLRGGAGSTAYEVRVRRRDGTIVELGVQGSVYIIDGQPSTIGMAQDISEKRRADEQIRRYVAQLEVAFMQTVEVATALSEMRDPYTAGHERRVAEIAVAIGTELGFEARRQEGLRVAGYLHDIGKIMIPSEILSRPGKLSAAEFALIKGHPQASYDVVKGVEFPWPVAQIVLQHHERVDGSGYPQGLKGDGILLEARILAVADVVEAMSSHRPYRPGLGIDKALAEIERGRGTAYDREIADVCLKLFREKGYEIPA